MPETTDAIWKIAQHDTDVLGDLLLARLENLEASGLDPKTYALVSVAGLIGLDAAPASYVWQISQALDAGATPEEIIGVLVALSPIVGNAKAVAAAPGIALGLGVDMDLTGQEG